MMKKIITFVLSAFLLIFAGCEKDFLETQPTDDLSADVIFQSYEGALTTLDGTYRLMYDWKSNHNEFNQKAMDLNIDLKGDDMRIYSEGYGWFTDQYGYEDRDQTQRFTEFIWDYSYDLVNNSNRILANIDNIDATEEQYNYVKGQALAIRAYAYFNLVRTYQHTYVGHENDLGIPLYDEPQTEGNPRATVEEVYTAIENDLLDAIDLLNTENCLTREEAGRNKSHINQDVAEGIMARVKLNKEEWGEAASYAAAAVEDYELYEPEEYTAEAFNTVDAKEWMWGAEINAEHSTIFASFFSHMDPTFMTYAQLGLQKLINEPLYEEIPNNDVRKDMWLDSEQGSSLPQYCQMKFLASSQDEFLGDYLFMRASEMYLIQAEALANAGDDSAPEKLEALVSNREPGYSIDLTGEDLLEEIYFQRRVELWGEGFRLYDIKRRKQAVDREGHDPALAQIMYIEPESYRMVYQIPESELDDNDQIDSDDQNP